MPDVTETGPTPTTKRLADLRIAEVSGVDHPAHLTPGWLVLKSRQPTEGGSMPEEINREALAPEVLSYLEGVEAERDEAVAKAAGSTSTEPDPAKAPAPEPDPNEDPVVAMVKSLGDEHPFVKAMKATEARALAAETLARGEVDRRITNEFVAVAKSLDSLSIDADEFGPLLKSITEKCPEEAVKVVEVLKAANETVAATAAFKTLGPTEFEVTAGSALDRINKAAEVIAERDGVDIPTAFTKAVEENGDLYVEYLAEQRKAGVN